MSKALGSNHPLFFSSRIRLIRRAHFCKGPALVATTFQNSRGGRLREFRRTSISDDVTSYFISTLPINKNRAGGIKIVLIFVFRIAVELASMVILPGVYHIILITFA